MLTGLTPEEAAPLIKIARAMGYSDTSLVGTVVEYTRKSKPLFDNTFQKGDNMLYVFWMQQRNIFGSLGAFSKEVECKDEADATRHAQIFNEHVGEVYAVYPKEAELDWKPTEVTLEHVHTATYGQGRFKLEGEFTPQDLLNLIELAHAAEVPPKQPIDLDWEKHKSFIDNLE